MIENHLETAKRIVRAGGTEVTMEEAHLCAQLATAHALIAICERMDKATEQNTQASQEDQDAAGWVDIDDNLL